MDFVLYNAPQSTCSQRVRYTLNLKGVPFEEHKLDLFRGDQLKPEYLAINPNGVVPSLVHRGKAITDSAVIIEYIDEVVDGHRLVPEDPVERARMRAMLRYIDEVPTPAVRVPSYNLAFLPHYQKMTEEEFLALCESKPLRREFLMRMGRTGFPQAEMDEALERLRRGIERFASWLRESGGPWAMGGSITLPDIAILPVIVRTEDIGLGSMWKDNPEITEWLKAIKATPPFKPTYYPGALLTEQYPHLRNLGS